MLPLCYAVTLKPIEFFAGFRRDVNVRHHERRDHVPHAGGLDLLRLRLLLLHHLVHHRIRRLRGAAERQGPSCEWPEMTSQYRVLEGE